jgi:hypothetical protein
MREGTPTYEQLCQVIGAVYSDAYLRIEFLENENRKLREAHQKQMDAMRHSLDLAREENRKLKETWNNGKGSITPQESSPDELLAKFQEHGFMSSLQQRGNDSSPPKSTGTPGEKPVLTGP